MSAECQGLERAGPWAAVGEQGNQPVGLMLCGRARIDSGQSTPQIIDNSFGAKL